MHRKLWVPLCLVAVAGCNPKPAEPPGPYKPPTPSTAEMRETVKAFDNAALRNAQEALDKAKGVAQTVEQGAAERGRQIEQQSDR